MLNSKQVLVRKGSCHLKLFSMLRTMHLISLRQMITHAHTHKHAHTDALMPAQHTNLCW